MNYNSQMRKDIKRECKERVQEQIGRCVGIRVLYMLPTLLTTAILYISIFGRAIYTVMSGNTDERVLVEILSEGMGSNIALLVSLVTVLIIGPLSYGLVQFYIGIRHGEEAGVSTLFKPFTTFDELWAGIKMEACLTFRAMVWMCVPTIAATSVGVGVAMFFADAGDLFTELIMIGIYTVYFIFLIPVKVKLKEYEAGWVVVNKRRDLGVWDATRISGDVFYGRFGSLFGFMASFLGWYLLQYALTGACAFFAVYGLIFIGGTVGVATAAFASVSMFCITALLSGFVSAYMSTSFIALFEYFAAFPGDVPNMRRGYSQATHQDASDDGPGNGRG